MADRTPQDRQLDRKEVVGTLEEIATLLELRGENPFKIRAYTSAARRLQGLGEDPIPLIREGRHAALEGIGKALAGKLSELVATGRLGYLEELRRTIPDGLVTWLKLPGLGPKRARAIHETLGISTIGELEYACQENRLVDLPGFGPKLQERILAGIARLREHQDRFLAHVARAAAEALVERLRPLPTVERVEIAGSLRRRRETVGDIDVVVATDEPAMIHEAFVTAPDVAAVVGHGTTKSTVRLASGIHADLRTVAPPRFPFLLHHLTGSAAHNTTMRARARARGWKLNEYGLFDGDGQAIPASDEADVFRALDLAWIPPELREDLGEIEAAARDALPSLVTLGDVRGVVHAHTTWSDGAHTVRQMAEACRAAGYAYLVVSDHSQSVTYARGLTPERVRAQQADIDEVAAAVAPFRVLKGTEVDILKDGGLDYDDETLATFDVVIASVHSHFGMDGEAMTDRICTALRHPRVHMLGHPTGRLLLGRDGYAVDLERVLAVAAEEGVVVEINANPHRLDLDWRLCRRARELGVKLAVNPDAHRVGGVDFLAHGIGVARKGWLTRDDVVNCLPADELLAVLAAAHGGRGGARS